MYQGMGKIEATGLLMLMCKLWPRWKNTPELNGAWVELLAKHPRDVAEAVIRSHVAERTGSPSMPDVAKKLDAARRQSRQAEAGEVAKAKPAAERRAEWPPQHMADVFDMWGRNRDLVEQWLCGLTEQESRRWRYYLETPSETLRAHRASRKAKADANGGGA